VIVSHLTVIALFTILQALYFFMQNTI